MFERIRIAGMAALIGLGAWTGAPGAAQADSLYFGFGIGAPDRIPGESFRSYRDHRRDWRRDRATRRCTPGQALRKAERLGLRRAHIADVDRYVIRVVGRKHHSRRQVVFARAAHCPIVDW